MIISKITFRQFMEDTIHYSEGTCKIQNENRAIYAIV
jgi:hypothetical protein